MPTKKQVGVGGGVVAGIAAVLVGFGHWAGGLVDDGVRLGSRVADDVPIPVESESIEVGIKQGVQTFKGLRNGDEYDQALVKAACAAMDQYYSQSPTRDQVRDAIYAELPEWVQNALPVNKSVAGKFDQVTTAVAIATESNGRASYYYVRYCMVR